MRITESQLRKIIREELINEVKKGPPQQTGDALRDYRRLADWLVSPYGGDVSKNPGVYDEHADALKQLRIAAEKSVAKMSGPRADYAQVNLDIADDIASRAAGGGLKPAQQGSVDARYGGSRMGRRGGLGS